MEREILALWHERRHLPTFARTDRRRSALDLLRGPADRQRQARHAPRRGPGLQGRLPALQDHAGLPGRPQGRLGLPGTARRGGGREGARPLGQAARSRSTASRSSTRSAGSRCSAHVDEFEEMTERMAYWVDMSQAYRTMDPSVHRERVVVAEADLRQGPALRGAPHHAVLPPLRDRPVRPRARQPGGYETVVDPSVYVRLPLTSGPVRRPGRPAGVDHDAVDPRVQHRCRGQSRRRRTSGHRRHRDRRGGRAALRERCSARAGRSRTGGRAATWSAGPTSARWSWSTSPGRARALRHAGRLRHHGGRHRAGAQSPAFGGEDMAVAAEYGMPVVNPVRPRRPLRGRRAARRRPVLQARRRRPGARAGVTRSAVPARGLRALLPALLAVPHAAHVLRPPGLVHPHHADQGRAAAGEREDQLVPGDDQVGPLRRLAAQQRRLVALAQPLLGHPVADLAMRRRPPHLRRVAGRARGAGRRGPERASTRTGRSSTTSSSPVRRAAARPAASPR